MGMKNHEIVPTTLICSISGLKSALVNKALKSLHKNKLIVHDGKAYDGFKLTYLGYDFLALKAMSQRESISAVGKQIGVGKESDIFLVANSEGEELCLKLHRLGRTSFRAIKNKRDYLRHRKAASWLYMSRLAALKEFAFMKALYEHDFPVPKPIDHSRHCVVMSLCKGFPLCHVAHVRHPDKVYSDLMNIIVRLAEHGLIHCDFNEFNLMIDDEENITLIDFPQMVSTTHENAEFYFDRDVQCIRTYFERRYNFVSDFYPKFGDYGERVYNLDVEVEASGFSKKLHKDLEGYIDRDNVEDGELDEQPNFDDIDEYEDGNEVEEDEEEEREDEEDEEDEEETQEMVEAREERRRKLAEMRKKILEQQRVENDEDSNVKNEMIPLSDDTEKGESLDFLDDGDNDEGDEEDAEESETKDEEVKKSTKANKKRKNQPASAHVRERVKKNLARKNKPKLKPNSNKNRKKINTRAAIKDGDW